MAVAEYSGNLGAVVRPYGSAEEVRAVGPEGKVRRRGGARLAGWVARAWSPERRRGKAPEGRPNLPQSQGPLNRRKPAPPDYLLVT